MNCIRNMLNTVMDGIRDTNMLIDYAEEAYSADKGEWGNWFKSNARKRADALESAYEYVAEQIGLEEKVKAGDEISAALHSHIEEQMEHLHRRLSAL